MRILRVWPPTATTSTAPTSAAPSRIDPSGSRTRKVVPTTSILGAGTAGLCCVTAGGAPAQIAAASNAARRRSRKSNRPHVTIQPVYNSWSCRASASARQLDPDDAQRMVTGFGGAAIGKTVPAQAVVPSVTPTVRASAVGVGAVDAGPVGAGAVE